MNEFNLSEKIEDWEDLRYSKGWLYAEDVKKFIRRLKEGLHITKRHDGMMDIDYINDKIPKIINELAGDKLKC